MRFVLMLPRIILGSLVLFAIGVMLYGVLMRYVVLPVTDWLNLDPPDFFWVEEVGEMALAWLTLLGAAIAVKERSHFALSLFVHRLPRGGQAVVHVAHNLIIAAFGGLTAWLGYQLVLLNITLTTPALEINMGWLYGCAVAGGILMLLYALDAARRPHDPDHSFADVRE
ncbi:MAG TPA: TRAP transporter small permease [Rhodopila sp.]|uniref:TRAP transporter small permease n=1 Tax=Rhodopila sp. TaxID=2480087 RepID=UPI002C03CCD5|nr:TRAP transporter small permease [Rhodopila sp.]HVY15105.1 TRAP transporter small permease [Rhodopila sp.]